MQQKCFGLKKLKMTDLELGWVAGLYEGEGCTSFKGSSITVSINMTDEDIIRKLSIFTGIGNITGPYLAKGKIKPYWIWTASNFVEIENLLRQLLPLLGKRRTAQINAAFLKRKNRKFKGRLFKTYCRHGHEMSGCNLLIYKGGRRQCKICQDRYEVNRPLRSH